MNVSGDIITVPEAGFPFVIECKKREEWTLDNVFLNNKDIKNWWAQVVGDARETGNIPMLVFSRNRAEDYVLLPYNESFVDHLSTSLPREPRATMYVEYEDEFKRPHGFNLILTTVKTLGLISPQNIRTMYDKEVYDWEKESMTTNLNGEYEKELEIPEEKVDTHISDLINKADI